MKESIVQHVSMLERWLFIVLKVYACLLVDLKEISNLVVVNAIGHKCNAILDAI